MVGKPTLQAIREWIAPGVSVTDVHVSPGKIVTPFNYVISAGKGVVTLVYGPNIYTAVARSDSQIQVRSEI